MNNSMRTAAAAAALVAGLVTVSGTANAAERPDRITSQEQLAKSIAQAVAVEQQNGAVTDGVIGGIVINTLAARSC
ncbi:hypothetical protein OG322_33045 [Streptomyces sp. NBC_01260]|uniref:hypothetical protein n=1 Tax=Streptomyces TaxID=1883 RepID=UPI000F4A9AEB|nr:MULTISPECIES: hypothetical protein [Streptomyces]MBO0915298.1 hypothetical protein [Streptomyces laculatispora]MCX4774088.1 hypothetical protein [Streptomyces sp. NBC_01285]ROQ73450.1 hypothetical protein EDD95_6116 [Streptomyces sp. CEV 2-1]RPK29331.1 hypothetical protein EES39_40050 [Streptomyces sp. ADI92-24]